MRPLHYHEGFKTKSPQRNGPNRELPEIQNEGYDGVTAEYGYSQVIFDLLRDPVSLGMPGANGNRGRQR